jgi:hypothetical protein
MYAAVGLGPRTVATTTGTVVCADENVTDTLTVEPVVAGPVND